MESIETMVIIRTHNNPKAVKRVKKLEKQGYKVESYSRDFHPYKDEYKFVLTKLEQFK